MKIFKLRNLKRKCTARLDDESNGFLSLNGKIYILNDVSYEILLMLENGSSQEKIINQLCKKYSVPFDVVSPDVEEFMNQLKEMDLI